MSESRRTYPRERLRRPDQRSKKKRVNFSDDAKTTVWVIVLWGGGGGGGGGGEKKDRVRLVCLSRRKSSQNGTKAGPRRQRRSSTKTRISWRPERVRSANRPPCCLHVSHRAELTHDVRSALRDGDAGDVQCGHWPYGEEPRYCHFQPLRTRRLSGPVVKRRTSTPALPTELGPLLLTLCEQPQVQRLAEVVHRTPGRPASGTMRLAGCVRRRPHEAQPTRRAPRPDRDRAVTDAARSTEARPRSRQARAASRPRGAPSDAGSPWCGAARHATR